MSCEIPSDFERSIKIFKKKTIPAAVNYCDSLLSLFLNSSISFSIFESTIVGKLNQTVQEQYFTVVPHLWQKGIETFLLRPTMKHELQTNSF